MANPWKVRNGIYELVDDSTKNRKKLVDHLTDKFKKDGFKPKAVLYGKDKIPQRIGTGSQAKIKADPNNEKLKLEIKRASRKTLRGSDMQQQGSLKMISGFTQKGIDKGRAEISARSTTGPVTDLEAHHKRMLQMYRPFFEGLSEQDMDALADFAFDSKYALGNDISNRALLSKPFHQQIHDFMRERGYQVSSAKIKKGYKYPGVPDLGNTLESRKNALSHFFRNVQDPIEAKLSEITWDQEDTIKPFTDSQLEQASAHFNDPDERLTFDQRQAGKTDSKWDWQVDSEGNRIKVPRNIETTELGGRLGGISSTISAEPHLFKDTIKSKVGKVLGNLTSKTRTADLVAQTATGVATGNPIQAGVAGGTLATTQVLQNPQVQKRIAKQIADLVAKRGAKTAAKFMPGVDIVLSGKESWDYLRQGRLDQAGIAALSGAIGWVPVIGDGASAALDLTNTGIDISRLDFNQQADTKKKKLDTDIPNNKSLKILSKVF